MVMVVCKIAMWPFMNSSALIGDSKIYFFQDNLSQDSLYIMNAVISTNDSTQFIIGHMVYNLAYT